MGPIRRKITPIGRFVESVLGDWLLNVHTRAPFYLGPKRGRNQDALDYATSTHFAVKKVIRLVQPAADDVVFDIGCGRGRAICHFAKRRVRKVVGIEISEQLCEIARTNARRLRNRRSPVEIKNADAAIADVSDGTIYYMFNPFGEETLCDVLKNIETSHDLTTARVTIIYMHALFAHVFDQFPCFEVVHEYQRANGHRVVIYRNRGLSTSNGRKV